MRLVGYLNINILNIVCSDADEYEDYGLEMCRPASTSIDIVKIIINLSEAKILPNSSGQKSMFRITTVSTVFQVNNFYCVSWIEGGV